MYCDSWIFSLSIAFFIFFLKSCKFGWRWFLNAEHTIYTQCWTPDTIYCTVLLTRGFNSDSVIWYEAVKVLKGCCYIKAEWQTSTKNKKAWSIGKRTLRLWEVVITRSKLIKWKTPIVALSTTIGVTYILRFMRFSYCNELRMMVPFSIGIGSYRYS